MSIEDKYTGIITGRIEFLEKLVDQDKSKTWNREKAEINALKWTLKHTNNEELNILENRAYNNGQKTILSYYRKALKKAVRTNNLSTLQFLLDRTTEWLEEKEENEA